MPCITIRCRLVSASFWRTSNWRSWRVSTAKAGCGRSLRSGAPGFLHVVDEQTLQIGGYGHPDDPLAANVTAHDQIGMIVINLAARSRLRLNGTALLQPDGKILLTTNQVYGNCQQYIQARPIIGDEKPSDSGARKTVRLDERQRNWVAQADTFFIATAHFQAGADASHRGGKPGLVRAENEHRLIFLDYRGNNMFNTLGNIASNPRAGLLFLDFQTGAALQLTGSAKVLWDDARLSQFPGAERLVGFDVEQVIELPQATCLRFRFESYAPDLPS